MSMYDPPSDPYGDEVRCPMCDREMEYNWLTRDYECTCEDGDAWVVMVCRNCDWEYDGMLSEAHEDWTIACPECGGRVSTTFD